MRLDDSVVTITIDETLDSHALEAMRLELHRLADSYGLVIESIQVESVKDA